MEEKLSPLKKLEQTLNQDEMDLVHKAISEHQKVQKGLERHPVVFTLLGAFGVASVFYGFEKFFDNTILADYPLYMIVAGIVLLSFTGLLLKKL